MHIIENVKYFFVLHHDHIFRFEVFIEMINVGNYRNTFCRFTYTQLWGLITALTS